MKNIIIKILTTGFSTTRKYKLQDLCKWLYPLQYILRDGNGLSICCNENKFWSSENNGNRSELLLDICGIRRRNMTDDAYFRIINRFENGDKYGIEVVTN